jgi:glucose/arabinose dehydrogenase
MRSLLSVIALIGLGVAVSLTPAPSRFLGLSAHAQEDAVVTDYDIVTLADGLDLPWASAFLPNGDMLVTELDGRLRLISNGALVREPIGGIPSVYRASQGGLMDLVLHPNFAENQLVYLSLASGTASANALRVIRGTFTGSELTNIQTVFEAAPSKDTPVHYGGRMTFLPDHSLLITVGDGFDYREEAQNPGNHFGTIVRVLDDGKVPEDNPFVAKAGSKPEVWTYGHRNAQSIMYDAERGQVFATEHGPRGGDELNLIEAGKNYGWPAISYGINYTGARVSPFTALEGMEQPLKYWVPSIGPSGMSVYRGGAFPQWEGDILVSSLVFNHVRRLKLESNEVVSDEVMFPELDRRVRDVRVGPDGLIYLLLEGNEAPKSGQIVRIQPKS